MRMILCLAATIVLFVSCSTAQIGSKALSTAQKSKLLETPKQSTRPKLTMQDALAIAERYLATQRIDTNHFWLYRADWILFGGPEQPAKDKPPGWHFWWQSDSGEIGNYIEVFVSMDGACRRLGSM